VEDVETADRQMQQCPQQRPSAGWRQTRHRLARVHARAANTRRDALHKLTTNLAGTHGTIVVERLNVAGMVRNRRLARAIADAGFAELRRQLGYKTTWYRSMLVIADQWYPSSKTCSACGTAKAKLSLSARVFACDDCGLVIDRDLNAARNLAALVKLVSPGVARRPKTPVEGAEDPAQPGRPL
jgi:putative transposase